MVNLNKKLVTKDELLKYVSPLNIINFYSGREIRPGQVTISPLRDENNPSFGVFYKNNELFFKDFVIGGGDSIKFVMLKYNLNYLEALSKIVIDFNLKDKFFYKNMSLHTINSNFKFIDESKIDKKENKTYLNIKKRKWQKYDIKYWKMFGISYKILKFYNVYPVSHIFLNDNIIKADKYSYAFVENKDNNITFKIYQPFNKKIKWLSSHNESIWQGWEQLPETGYNLIITKSLKDIMCLFSTSGINSTALQAENVTPKKHVINELKDRFENIYLLYDNDFDSKINWGRKFGKKISNAMEIPQIEIPTKYKSKDISDFTKRYGKKETLKLINNLIYNKK